MAGQPVIQSPPDVPLPGATAVAPPGVALGFGMEEAEGIHHAGVHVAVHPVPLNVHESGLFPVGLGPGQIDFGVARVQVARHQDRVSSFHFLGYTVQKVAVVVQLVVQALRSFSPVWEVAAEHTQAAYAQNLSASFHRVLGVAKAVQDTVDWDSAGHSHAAVALFFRVVPVPGVDSELVQFFGLLPKA